MDNKEKTIVRYTPGERVEHWIVAIAFVLLALSGLALFQFPYYYLAQIFGGGEWDRILHPFFGVVFAISFAFMAVRMWRFNRLTAGDRGWLTGVADVVANHEERVPPPGKYNAGQKLLFRVMVASVVLLLLTGIVVWRPWFAPYFPPEVWRIAIALHALSAFVIIIGIIVHVYASIWMSGSIPAMLRGRVSAGWAKQHHGAWYAEIVKQEHES